MSVLDVPAEQYHRDALGTDQPSLSASIAKILLAESPAHAKAKHPRLSDFPIVREDNTKFDLGTAVHALLLEGKTVVDPLRFADWRTKASKEARDRSRAAGRVPMLQYQWEKAQEVVDAVRDQLERIEITPRPLRTGKPEQTITWEEDGVYCKARPDWIHNDQPFLDDLKTSERSVNPEGWGRFLFSMGYDVQEAWYRRGYLAVYGEEARFRFVACEIAPPYAVSVMSLAPDAQAIADAKVEHAIKIWRGCLETGRWPGYADKVAFIEAPPWEEARLMEKLAA